MQASGHIRRCNQAARELFDLNRVQMVGRVAASLFVAPDKVKLPTADMEKTRVELITVRADGTQIPLDVSIATAMIGDDPHTVWMCRDLTVQKQEEEARLNLQRELGQAQKLESLGTLASGIAHEINTPVQYVMDNVRFLKDSTDGLIKAFAAYGALMTRLSEVEGGDKLSATTKALVEDTDVDFVLEEMPDALAHAADGLTQIAKIVGAVKSFAHPGTEDKVPLDLNESVENTITLSKTQWKYVADLTRDFDPALPRVLCYPGELNQVVLNLIVNAAQAIEENRKGEQLGHITVSTSMTENWAEIRVADTGGGIPEAIRNRIFDPFFTTKDVGKGTGQGLSLSHQIITQNHQGELVFDSEEGVGTVFIIRLPL